MLNRTTLLLAIVWAASGCADDSPDNEGGGGAGGAGNQSATTQTNGSSQTVTGTNATTQTSSTSASSTSSTTGTGMGCDSYGDCQSCMSCVIDDTQECKASYLACLGESQNCSDGEPDCCSALMCREACSFDPANYWACMCGSADQASCDPASAPAGTCAGDHPVGFPLLYGPNGFYSCVESNCPASCGDLDP